MTQICAMGFSLMQMITLSFHSNAYNQLQHFETMHCQRLRMMTSLGYNFIRKGQGLRKERKLYALGTQNTNFEARGDNEREVLLDCGSEQNCGLGDIVALGKFEALHVGHRALAIQASTMGDPSLLSFQGMAEVLGWEKRLPIVALPDRKRIMALWAASCGGIAPKEYQMEFAKVRTLSPREFILKLATEVHVKGVVAGANYRFGYKAAGDVSDLVQICTEYGLKVSIVESVMDDSEKVLSRGGNMSSGGREKGQVSSTRVRHALAVGDMPRVTYLLGRMHRLVLMSDGCHVVGNRLSVSRTNLLNQPPQEGSYAGKLTFLSDQDRNGTGNELMMDGKVDIGAAEVVITLSRGTFSSGMNQGSKLLGIDIVVRIL